MTQPRLRLFAIAFATVLVGASLALAQPPNANPSLDDTTNAGGGAAAGCALAFGCAMQLTALAVAVIVIASLWKIFTKAGKPGWAAIVPIYNIYVLTEIVEKPIVWFVCCLIPCVNVVMGILIALELAKKFGKDAMFGVGLILLPFIFYPILGFGKAQYQGTGMAPPM